MTLKGVANIVYTMYYTGRMKITSQTLSENKIMQLARFSYANVLRNLWDSYKAKKGNSTNALYLFSGTLLRKSFSLSEASPNGRRSIDMSKFEVIKMPYNSHIFLIEPVEECSPSVLNITIVKTGESRFYKDPEFSHITFGEPIGLGIDFYNIPSGIKNLEITSTFYSPDMDLPDDIAFDIAKGLMGLLFEVKSKFVKMVDDNDPNVVTLKQAIAANSTAGVS